jgi:ATP-dependent helicase YprA (DUF1998 family)/Zn finger protein HypA/HybF involved in hydrogenase expression
MTQSVYSVQSVVEGLKGALHQYLEAQYHIWDESLIAERRQLFSESGATFHVPALEATPFYTTGKTYREMLIPSEGAVALERCSGFPGTGVFQQPFKHQAEAIEHFVGNGRDIIVATGTGSGKTECFLLPLLASLAIEVAERPETAQMHGCRALLLYPMNALVNDQLGRLRRLFGDEGVASVLAESRGRPVQFGVYTSRTPYPGARSKKTDKLRLDLMFAKLYANASEEIKERLRNEGKWPAKNMELFAQQGYTTGPNDRELFTRHEMQATCPDILVTNYSMLEYMLIRPIERSIFDQTKEWLKKDERNSLIVVLDEAHMYRGAAGAEVALLLRRLQSRLEVDRTRLKYILTSASLGSSVEDEVAVRNFAAELTGLPGDAQPFVLIKGQPDVPTDGRSGKKTEAEALANFNFTRIQAVHSDFAGAVDAVQTLLPALGLKAINSTPMSPEQLQHQLFLKLTDFSPARLLAAEITGKPKQFAELSKRIFPEGKVSERALESLLALATFARRQEDQRVFLPVRLHLFFRGVSGIFSCINPQCSEKRTKGSKSLLGRMYSEPRIRCACGGRVFEILTHRDCGAAFIRGFMRGHEGDFLWHESDVVMERGRQTALLETHLLIEPERLHPQASDTAKVWLHIVTGRISLRDPNDSAFLPVYRPTSPITVRGRQILSFDGECPVCQRGWRIDNPKIMDLATKGDAPFAHLVKTQVKLQPPTRKEDSHFPNGGRKSLIFSDGRQKAARLARDIPREIEQDVFRQTLILAVNELQSIGKESRLDDQHIYTAFIHVLAKFNLRLFDGEDQANLLKHVAEYKKDFGSDLSEAISDHFSRRAPARFDEQLLRQLGNSFYSLSALTLAVVTPSNRVRKQIQDAMKEFSMSEVDIDAITISWISGLLDKMAFNEELQPGVRAMANGYWRGDWGILPGKPKKRLSRINDVYGRADEIEKILLEKLAGQNGAAYFIKPDKVILRLVTNEQWNQCTRCTSLSLMAFRGQCPNCQSSTLVSLNPNTSDYLRARKQFWRDPVIKMLSEEDRPFNIDVEEHTAQLAYRDNGDISSTTEEFERRFKDILLHDNDMPIDVLSSTTTMEVGIDIGSLVAVGLRNIPPMRQNYQQRAGRAGRRGSSLSTVITYAQNSPHDHYYFTHPELVIAGDPPLPAIDVRNPRIIERHVHSAILQAFFHAKTRDLPSSSNLFTVLGLTKDFYSSQSIFSLDALEQWMVGEEEGRRTIQRIDAWIPKGLHFTAAEVSQRFIATLREHRPADVSQATGPMSELLDHLFSKGLLPSYAFPRDLCALQIEERVRTGNPNRTINVKERPQQGLNIALSEYAPGRLVVVNKKTYRIGAVVADMPGTEIDRAAPLFASTRKYVHCKDCLYIQGHSDTFISGKLCPLCRGQNLSAIDVIQPEVVFPEGTREIYELDDDQVFTEVTSAQLPIPEGNEIFQWRQFEVMGQLVHAPNQSLIIVNKGEESDLGHTGFSVCDRCGSASLPANTPTGPHARHYLVDNGMQQIPQQCNGTFQNVYLGYTFLSDILLLRVPLQAPLNLNLQNRSLRKPIEDALVSLSDAIALAACQLLDIDPRELGNGVRFARTKEGMVADIFLFDTASGGAGYSNMAGKIFDKVFANVQTLLESCDCDTSCHKCLRHYGNRRSHADLNRYLALDMWRYVMHGTVPATPTIKEQRGTLDPLVQMLELEGWKPVSLPGVPVAVERNGTQHVLGSYPSILDPSAARHPLEGRALLFSKYEIERNLPGAFALVRDN